MAVIVISVVRFGSRGRTRRRLGAPGRRINDCRKRVHIVRFCMLGAKGAKTFAAACSADGVDGPRQQRWYLSKVAVESAEGVEGSALPDLPV